MNVHFTLRRCILFTVVGLCVWISYYFMNVSKNLQTIFLEKDKIVTENWTPKLGGKVKVVQDVLSETESSFQINITSLKLSQITTRGNPSHISNIIPILLMTCNRPKYLQRTINSLVNNRRSSYPHDDSQTFPIIVSQDCTDNDELSKVISDNISRGHIWKHIRQPDLSSQFVDPNTNLAVASHMLGYYKISRHYKFALDTVFSAFFSHSLQTMNLKQVIVIEDDMEIGIDFYSYFENTLPILRDDPTLFCISAWNDNGVRDRVYNTIDGAKLLYRSDFFGGLGWLLTKQLYVNELQSKWPSGFWDDWLRDPTQRKSRACIRPEISRTRTFGSVGTSSGQFFDSHLAKIVLNERFNIDFASLNLTYLHKDAYDTWLNTELETSEPVHNYSQLIKVASANQQKANGIFNATTKYILRYKSESEFVRVANKLGLMSDEKAGIHRMEYNGVISFVFNGCRVCFVKESP